MRITILTHTMNRVSNPITNNANVLQTNLLQTRVFIHFYNSGCSWGAGGTMWLT